MHKITLAALLLALAAGGCAGAPLEKSDPPDGPRRAQPAAGELHRLARRLPQPSAGAGHRAAGLRRRLPRRRRQRRRRPARWQAGRVHQADLGISRQRRLADPDRDRPRRARAELDGTLAAIEARYGVDRQAVLAIWGMESNYGKQPRLDPGDREPRHPRLRGPPPQLRRGAADRRAAHPAVRRRRAGGDAGLLGGRHGPHPVHPDLVSLLRGRLRRRRPPRRLVRRPDRRAGLHRELPQALRLDPRPALGHRGAAAGGLQLRQRRPVEHPARSRTGAPAASR